jgi:hypothetical protein
MDGNFMIEGLLFWGLFLVLGNFSFENFCSK